MVYCEECSHYGRKCTNPSGVFYKKPIDINLNIECLGYFDLSGEEDLSTEEIAILSSAMNEEIDDVMLDLF